ncbi:hypothetical protein RRG08_001982 [Elysia crispata]|uniref:Uncharacterized protein n=1 Tax=Elysia crispata TaxID=231223 RepID=A0AAE1BBD9_9GAST|nr:hypothetical protein RRG08_001982 [Elysia crispata]
MLLYLNVVEDGLRLCLLVELGAHFKLIGVQSEISSTLVQQAEIARSPKDGAKHAKPAASRSASEWACLEKVSTLDFRSSSAMFVGFAHSSKAAFCVSLLYIAIVVTIF